MSADRLVLCYHAVSESWPSELAVEPDRLRRQVRSLLDDGYEAKTFSEAAAGQDGKVLSVTFDDAFDSVFELALPVLSELGVPATVFVPTDFPDSGVPFPLPWNDWVGSEYEGELRCMSWDRVRALRDAGWEIGSHTCSHPWLTQIAAERLQDELRRSREVCAEQLGEAPTSIAYPYGDHDDRVVAATDAAGYSFACTVPHRFDEYGSPPLRVGRIDVTRTEPEWAFRARAAPQLRRVRERARPMAAAKWLDHHRPHRATLVRGYERLRGSFADAAAVKRLCENSREILLAAARRRPCDRFLLRSGVELRLRANRDALAEFLDAFVDDPLARRLADAPRGVAVDVGAGGDLLWARLATMGFDRVVCVDPSSPAEAEEIEENRAQSGVAAVSVDGRKIRTGSDLGNLLARSELGKVDFLRLRLDADRADLLTGVSAATLAGIERMLVVLPSDSSEQWSREVADTLREAGFGTEVEAGRIAERLRVWARRR